MLPKTKNVEFIIDSFNRVTEEHHKTLSNLPEVFVIYLKSL